MKYSENRHKIKSGDIIALSHYKWASFYDLQIQAVRIFTQSEYTHVGLVWECAGRLFVIESVTPVIRMVPLSTMAEEGFYHIPMNVPITYAELEFALDKVGNGKYSKWQAIKAQLNLLKSGEDNLWQCCEFVKECRKLSGVDVGNKITPSGVVKHLQELGYAVSFYDNK